MADTLTIDGVTYPNTFDAVVKDNRIAKAYATHCKKIGTYEAFKFILTRFDPDVHFVEFISDSAPSKINISAKVRDQMLELAKSTDEKDWKASNWSGPVTQAKNELRVMMKQNTLTGGERNFFKSDDFFRVHSAAAAQQNNAPEITKSNYTSIAKAVGYANPADILTREFLDDRGMIELLIGHQRGGRAAESKKLVAALKKRAKQRNENTVVGEEDVDNILNTDFERQDKAMKALLDFGNTEPGPNAIEINIDKKLLSRLDMELMDDKKSMQMLNDTVHAYVTGETADAKQLFEKMRKRYPKDHALHAGSVKALILALKRAKLIEAVKI